MKNQYRRLHYHNPWITKSVDKRALRTISRYCLRTVCCSYLRHLGQCGRHRLWQSFQCSCDQGQRLEWFPGNSGEEGIVRHQPGQGHDGWLADGSRTIAILTIPMNGTERTSLRGFCGRVPWVFPREDRRLLVLLLQRDLQILSFCKDRKTETMPRRRKESRIVWLHIWWTGESRHWSIYIRERL